MFAPLSCAPDRFPPVFSDPPARLPLRRRAQIFSKAASIAASGLSATALEWSNEEPLFHRETAPEPPPLRRVRSARDERRRCAPRSASQARGVRWSACDKYIFYAYAVSRLGSPSSRKTVSYLFEDEAARCAEPESRVGEQVRRPGPAPRELAHHGGPPRRSAMRIERRRTRCLLKLTDGSLIARDRGPCSQTPPSGYARRGGAGRWCCPGCRTSGARGFSPSRHSYAPLSTRAVERNPTHALRAGHGGRKARRGLHATMRASRRRRRLDLRDLVPLDPARCRRRAPRSPKAVPPEAGAAGNAPTGTRLPGFHAFAMIRLPSASALAENERAGVEASSERRCGDRAQGPRRGGGRRRGPRKEGRGARRPRRVRRGHVTEWFPADTLRSESSGDGSAAAGVVVEPPRRVHATRTLEGALDSGVPTLHAYRSPEYHAEAAPEGLRTNKHIFDRSGVFALPHDGRIAPPS
ncbi:hypothetical protein Q5P01_000975 [Channa striata]|uniref:Uncharacterized protein n=1 Tax=Channa striata TaxID=64152 RepID=A0AA88IHK7_CHASR|nr:hypothetical protein Q5P01_000975 [Channa striata]